MEQNEKSKKVHFNVIDLVIVVLIVACIAGVFVRKALINSFDASPDLEKAEISFLTLNVRYTSADYFTSGKEVYISANSLKLGEFMKGFTITPAEKYIAEDDGKIIKVNYPENTQIDVRGKILSEGKWTDEGFLVDGNYYIAAGSNVEIQTDNFCVNILITDISKAS